MSNVYYFYCNWLKRLSSFISDLHLFSFLQTHFKIRCLQPPTYSSEPPVFLEENKLQVAEKGCGTTEAKIYKELESHVVIFEKV